MTQPAASAKAKIVLGTRRSPLAMAQARETQRRLCAAHGWDESAVELAPVLASGDKIRDIPLADIGGKALWTKELDQWLLDGRIDASVHSMKDVETVRPAHLMFAAILPRADVRDVLVGASSIAALAPGAVVGTSAPRRAAQLLNRRPDVTVQPIRGNVATRLSKLAAGEADATFLAAAGLARLGETGTGTALDAEDWLPAPAQGAIGIECRRGDDATAQLLGAINDHATHKAVMAERALLFALGGSCHSPIAALTTPIGCDLKLRAAIYSPSGAEKVAGDIRFAPADLSGPRDLAQRLLSQATAGIRPWFAGA